MRCANLVCVAAVIAVCLLTSFPTQGAPRTILRDCDDCPEMLAIPAGQFELGTGRKLRVNTEVPAELTPVAIRIERPFALGRFEVTRREYRAFVLATHRTTRAKCRTWVDSRQGFADLTIAWDEPNVPARPTDRHPATCVDWHDAAAYAAWLAQKTGKPYRLPSEVEWEYAAKAGTRTLRPWGNDPNQGCEHANSFDLDAAARRALAWKPAACRDGFSDIAPVGSLKPNRFGLHDMIGNVWEWIADCSTLTYVGRPTDQRAWVWDGGCKRRIQRGGGWITAPDRSRSSFHGDGDDEDRADFAGFRVARDLP